LLKYGNNLHKLTEDFKMTSKTLILIDGHALAYRCYFAL